MKTQRDQDKRKSVTQPEKADIPHSGVNFKALFNGAPVAYLVLDRKGLILEANQRAAAMLSPQGQQWRGKPLSEWIDPADRGHLFLKVFEVCRSGQSARCEVDWIDAKQGRQRKELIGSAGTYETAGDISVCCVVILDRESTRQRENDYLNLKRESERRARQWAEDMDRSGHLLLQETQNYEQSVEKLSRMEALFDKVFGTSYLAIAQLDHDYKIVRVNQAFADILSQSVPYFQQKDYFELFPDQVARELFDRVLNTGEPQIQYARLLVSQGDDQAIKTWWDWSVSGITDRHGQIEGLLLCMANVTKRVELERDLMHITDREQQRLGRELHDGMAQLLTAVSIKAKMAEQLTDDGNTPLKTLIREMADLIREATVQTRDLSRLLNPVVVETQGLIPALEALAVETKRRMGVACDFQWDENMPTFSQVVAGHLYRIAQEAISNAVRHGQADTIHIKLVCENQQRILSISSNGQPFELACLEKSEGLGVRGMRYRAELIGGTFAIESRPSGGTVVTCTTARPLQV